MKKFIFCLLTLGIRFTLSTENGDCVKSVSCIFTGRLTWDNAYELTLTDVQNELNRCDIFSYGRYFFDMDDENSGNFLYIADDDKNTIKILVESGIPIYIIVNNMDKSKWSEILYRQDENITNSQIDLLIKFLKDYKISGIIMEGITLYDDETPYLDKHIILFTTKIKCKMDWLKVGLKINGQLYPLFTNTSAFNFAATNDFIDQYYIDMTLSNECTPKTQKESVNPIISTDKNMYTIKDQSIGVKKSAMNNCKINAMLQISVLESYEMATICGDVDVYGSYSMLCLDASKGEDIKRWCSDNSSMFYEQAKFVRDYFSGMALYLVDGDEASFACECGKYPITNIMISGWENGELQKCIKIDEIHKRYE